MPVPGGRECMWGWGDLILNSERTLLTCKCDSSVWVEAWVRLEIPRPSRWAACSLGHPEEACGTWS